MSAKDKKSRGFQLFKKVKCECRARNTWSIGTSMCLNARTQM